MNWLTVEKIFCHRAIVSALAGVALLSICGTGVSHPADENPSLTLPETTREFRQERFGLFIHWGLYSVLCDGESVMKNDKISQADYERMAKFFNPAKFDAAEWVMLARSAGMHFIVFTAKSEDGFPMWDSKTIDWNVVKSTPFGRDVVAELARECQRQHMKLFLYYSDVDKYQSVHLTETTDKQFGGTQDSAESTATLNYKNAQLTELFNDYGSIDGLWLGGSSGKAESPGQLQNTYRLIRDLQPATLIGNNHRHEPIPGEDFQVKDFELPEIIPGVTSATIDYDQPPIAMTQTINESRGYRITDNKYKSARDLVHDLVRAAAADRNLLFSVGPMPNGEFQQEFKDRLHRVGMWLAKNGESIYSTRGGPLAPQPWGVTTHRGKKIYLHVFDSEATTITLKVAGVLRSAEYLVDENAVSYKQDDETVEYQQTDNTVVITLRPEQPGEMERLILLNTRYFN